MRKRDDQSHIVRYKARLVAQGFAQRAEIAYQDTFAPTTTSTIFLLLLTLAQLFKLETFQLDVESAYLYGRTASRSNPGPCGRPQTSRKRVESAPSPTLDIQPLQQHDLETVHIKHAEN